MADEGFVYYMRIGALIKIGYTADVRKRMGGYPPETVLLAIEPGTYQTEADRLSQFSKDLEWGNEWFSPSKQLSEHVLAVRRDHGIPAGFIYEYRKPGQSRTIQRKPVAPTNEWITIAEGAESVGVSTKTIRRWVTAGLVDARRFGPRLIRIDPASLHSLGRNLTYGI